MHKWVFCSPQIWTSTKWKLFMWTIANEFDNRTKRKLQTDVNEMNGIKSGMSSKSFESDQTALLHLRLKPYASKPKTRTHTNTRIGTPNLEHFLWLGGVWGSITSFYFQLMSHTRKLLLPKTFCCFSCCSRLFMYFKNKQTNSSCSMFGSNVCVLFVNDALFVLFWSFGFEHLLLSFCVVDFMFLRLSTSSQKTHVQKRAQNHKQ